MSSAMVGYLLLIVITAFVGLMSVGMAVCFAHEGHREGDIGLTLMFLLLANVVLCVTVGALDMLSDGYVEERELYKLLKRTVYYD